MNQKLLLIFSAFITVFLLAAGGVIVKAVLTPAQPTDAVLQAYATREAQYNQMIQQANQQIDQANQQLQSMADQLAAAQQQTVATPQAVSIDYPVSADQALQYAIVKTGDTVHLIKSPELVSYQGVPAYEISFEEGVVYIDASNGAVLYSTVPLLIDEQGAARIASEYMHSNQIVKIDQVALNGGPVYRILFTSDYIVYIGLTGQILSVQAPEVASYSNSNSGSEPAVSQPAQGESENEEEDDD